ncbi:MAG TPA: acyl-CoA dehydrogenase family protein [Acidimicrobiia bacterium]|nr:acyl-CoA dehydrogenase family protein [Acidimicrobiia bacterium]
MTAVASPPSSEAPELADFRAEAKAWLEANAERRSTDSSDFKRKFAATHQTREQELQAVEASKAWQRRIYDAGYAGLTVPTEYGGRGLTAAHDRIWRQESARYAIDTGVFAVGLGMVVPTILVHGTEEQKREHVPALVRGEKVWCQLFSEPGAGSDLAGLTTRADRDGDEWIVNGQKVWNSYAHVADWGILLARTDWDVPKHRGISYFLVDMTTPGVEARPLRQITGVAHFNETFLTDVRIPNDNLLGGLNNGWAVAQTTLMNERTLIGGSGGGGVGFRDWVELARHYGRLGDPTIRQQLAALYTRGELLKWLGQRAQASMRAGKGPGAESSVAKLFASLHLEQNGNLAMAIEGASAMLYATDAFEDGFWQQQFLGQWASRIGGGTEQVQRNILGERVLGLPSEPRPDKTEPFRDLPKNT